MAVFIEWMIKRNEENEKNYLGAWKIKQETECNEGMNM